MEGIVAIVVAILGSGILNLFITRFFTKRDKNRDRKDSYTSVLRLIVKDRLRFLCIHYVNQGWIYTDELDDLIAMHDCYHDGLNGNGYLDELMKRVMQLEIRGIGVK